MRLAVGILTLWLILTGNCWPEDFLGSPLIPGGQVLSRTDHKIVVQYPMSHDQVLSFYREHFRGNKDIRLRDWKTETYIEDDGALPWHSIRISKGEGDTTVTVTRDSWTWIVGTLTLRFIGVFVVLLFLYVGMSLAGAVLSRLAKDAKPTKA